MDYGAASQGGYGAEPEGHLLDCIDAGGPKPKTSMAATLSPTRSSWGLLNGVGSSVDRSATTQGRRLFPIVSRCSPQKNLTAGIGLTEGPILAHPLHCGSASYALEGVQHLSVDSAIPSGCCIRHVPSSSTPTRPTVLYLGVDRAQRVLFVYHSVFFFVYSQTWEW